MKNLTKAKNIIEILNKKGYKALLVENKEKARELVLELIPKRSSVSLGGSVTLNQLNLVECFRTEDYIFFDRYKDVPFTETVELMRESLLSDYFITSINAITMDGELVNMDSTGNRVASMVFGPQKVIIIAGVNKIVDNLTEALERTKKVAIMNAKRINHKCPCTITNECEDCDHVDRVCNFISIVNNGRKFNNRYTIIIVPEELGY